MALIERQVVITTKDDQGNQYIEMPVTKVDYVEGAVSEEEVDQKLSEMDKGGMPVGFEYFTTNPNIPVGSLPLIGGTYSRTAYADLWEWVQTQTNYLISESAWQAKATANEGNVPFYSTGDGSTTFRVPSLSCWVKGASGVSEVGSYLKAGLPNIEGHASHLGLNANEVKGDYSGAFIPSASTIYYGGSSSGSPKTNLAFDASLSNPIYGNSDTVQPPSIVGMWLVKAFGTVSNAGNQDIADISAGLAITEGRVGNVEGRVYLKESYSDGTEWYRKWSDGWIEQGGFVSNKSTSNITISTIIPFSTANYAVKLTLRGSNLSNGAHVHISSTTTSFVIKKWDSCNVAWVACGY